MISMCIYAFKHEKAVKGSRKNWVDEKFFVTFYCKIKLIKIKSNQEPLAHLQFPTNNFYNFREKLSSLISSSNEALLQCTFPAQFSKFAL